MGWARENVPGYKQFVDPLIQGTKNFFRGVAAIFTGDFGVDFDSPDYSSSSAESIQGVLINKDSALADVPIVYGTRAVGGIRVFVSTGSGSNEYLYVAYVLSEGQVNGYTKLIIDDNTVTVGNYSHGTRSFATSGNYANESRLEVQFFDGRDDQVASTLLKEAPGWTDDHKLSGLAYIACKFRWKKIETNEDANNNPYGGGVPNLVVTLEGKKIMDIADALDPADYGAYISKPSAWTAVNNQNLRLSASGTPASGYTIRFDTTNADSAVRVQLAMTTGGTAGATTLTTSVTLQDDATLATIAAFTLGPTTSVETITQNIDEVYALPTGTYRAVFATTLDNSEVTGSTTSWTMALAIGPFTPTRSTLYANETVVFNNNPVNVLLDYMRNPRYGKGLNNSVINWLSFATAARLCDQVVTYTDSTSGKAFTCDAVIDTGQTLMDNVKNILIGFRGIMPYQQGKYVLKIEHGGDDMDITSTPVDPFVVFTATDDNIVGGINISGDSKRTKINRCRVVYVDPDADYQPNEVIYPEDGSADDVTYLAEDGIRLEKDITLPMTAVREQALQAAEVFVKRSRNFKQIAFGTHSAGSNLTVGDLFRVINNRLGLDGYFRCTELSIDEEGAIQVSGFEHQSSAYGINAKDVDIVRPTLSLPNPELVVAPTAVTAASGAAENVATGGGYLATDGTLRRINVTWTASTDPFVRDYIVEYKLSTDATFTTAGVTTRTQIYIAPVTLGAIYNIRVAARNELNRRSNFASASAHTVIA